MSMAKGKMQGQRARGKGESWGMVWFVMGTHSARPPGDTVPITLILTVTEALQHNTKHLYSSASRPAYNSLQEGSDLCTFQGSWCLEACPEAY